ncbi:hypothetical protein PHLGIDRAFT_388396 [Phlebiopsis gigantea 11061_1 CR5-6]|uniref:Uncharacterized protein n=1 Tax=Phlebiopsis gigantea (strain 11061_1 CR5-6) TaxID=745531 RepID=A0A0C3P8Z9_PHLG1|nr:hypothetical protein PHLGIDRAFT_388396 [Phlebiopsis gigantea 11061_1 CR5-6]
MAGIWIDLRGRRAPASRALPLVTHTSAPTAICAIYFLRLSRNKSRSIAAMIKIPCRISSAEEGTWICGLYISYRRSQSLANNVPSGSARRSRISLVEGAPRPRYCTRADKGRYAATKRHGTRSTLTCAIGWPPAASSHSHVCVLHFIPN